MKKTTLVLLIAVVCMAPLGIMAIAHVYYSRKAISLASEYGHSLNKKGPVISVSINNSKAARELIPYLRYMPDLYRVGIGGVHLNEEQLVAIGQLEQLEELSFGSCRLVDEDLHHFDQLANLRALRITFNGETIGDGIKYLAPLDSLEELNLSNTQITTNHWLHLTHLQSLRILRLVNVPIDDDSVPYLLEMNQLEKLDLTGTNVTLEGAMQLADLPNLQGLGVSDELFGNPIPERRANKKAFWDEYQKRKQQTIERARAGNNGTPVGKPLVKEDAA